MPSKRSPSSGREQAARTRKAVGSRRPQAATQKPSRFGFISDTIAEMKKVTWLTRREAVYLSGLVLIVAVSVGILTWA
jgi:preprotein translocase SecE subunit